MRVSWRRFESFFSPLASLSMSMIPGGSHGSIQQLSSKMAVVLSSLKETNSPLQYIGLPLTRTLGGAQKKVFQIILGGLKAVGTYNLGRNLF